MSPPLILLLFCVMGGAIAYIGDWLGRKMGKKRLRLAGLRPRHTATVFTVLVGALIPLVTTYGLITTSSQVRQWLTEGTQLVAQRNELLTVRNDLRQSVDSLTSNIEVQQAESEQLQTQIVTLREQGEKAEAQSREAQAKLAGTEGTLNRTAARVRQLEQQEAVLQANAAALTENVLEKTEEVERLTSDTEALEREVERLKSDTAILAEDTIALTRLNDTLEQDKVALEADVARLDNEASSLNRIVRERQAVVEQLSDQIGSLQATLSTMFAGIATVRTSPLLFHKDEELARVTTSGGISIEEGRNKIMDLVLKADRAARQRGVSPDPRGRAADLDERVRALPDGQRIRITVEDQINAFTERLNQSHNDMVLIATSYYNFFRDDRLFVPIEVDIYTNSTIYNAGDQVAQTSIDGTQPEDEIVEAIFEFLADKVRGAAQGAGMIPVQATGSSLGEVTTKQILDLMREIKQRNAPSTIVAYAARTTKAADSLELRFEVARGR